MTMPVACKERRHNFLLSRFYNSVFQLADVWSISVFCMVDASNQFF